MKRSVIFWNSLAILTYMGALISASFASCNCFLILLLIIPSILGLVVGIEMFSVRECSPLDFKGLKQSNFIHWWIYITISIICMIICIKIGQGIINFNKWLNKSRDGRWK